MNFDVYLEYLGELNSCIASCRPAMPAPKQVYFHEKNTTIVWGDGESTTVRCGEGETYDKYMAFCAAVCKRLYGSASHIRRMIQDMDVEEHKRQREAEAEKRREQNRKAEEERRKQAHDRRVMREVRRRLFEDEVEAAYQYEKNKLSGV